MDTQFDISRLLVLRKLTRAVAELLGGELRAHLATLAPLLHPRTVLGEYVRGPVKQSVKGEHEAYEQLRGMYAPLAAAAPFNLRRDLEAPVDLASVQPELTPAEYSHVARGGQETKTISVTSPLKWALSFSGFSPKRLRELLANQKTLTGNEIGQCVLQGLLLQVTLSRRPGLTELLQGLRYSVVTGRAEGLGELPVTYLECPVRTVLPGDDVIIQSTEISGAPVFEEVVNLDDIAGLADPLRERLCDLARSHGQKV